jgi:hypothetical protein
MSLRYELRIVKSRPVQDIGASCRLCTLVPYISHASVYATCPPMSPQFQSLHSNIRRCVCLYSDGCEVCSSWNTSPYSPSEVNRRFGGTYTSSRCFLLVTMSYSAYSTLKMEATCSSETSVDFQRATFRYITEESILFVYLQFV